MWAKYYRASSLSKTTQKLFSFSFSYPTGRHTWTRKKRKKAMQGIYSASLEKNEGEENWCKEKRVKRDALLTPPHQGAVVFAVMKGFIFRTGNRCKYNIWDKSSSAFLVVEYKYVSIKAGKTFLKKQKLFAVTSIKTQISYSD
jgi:hypothetical protein